MQSYGKALNRKTNPKNTKNRKDKWSDLGFKVVKRAMKKTARQAAKAEIRQKI